MRRTLPLLFLVTAHAAAQLNQNCTVSVLNRNVQVNADGSWVLPNIPANFGPVKARATCVQNGQTISGESAYFTVTSNTAVNLPDIILGSATPIPVSLTVTPASAIMNAIGQTTQLTVTALYPDSSTRNVAGAPGITYTTSNPAIASISPTGLVTAVASGTVVIQATLDGASGIVTARITLSSRDTDGDGINDDVEISNGLNPTNPTDAQEDFDRDNLTNAQEIVRGTDLRKADTDGDGLSDGDEVPRGTNPLLTDTDGDGIPDGVEADKSCDPLIGDFSACLPRALQSLVVTPASFTLTVNTINPISSVQLSVRGTLSDGRTVLDLASNSRGTNYTSSNLSVCTLDASRGIVFAGSNGNCTITVTNGFFSRTATGTVSSFTPTALSFVAIPGFANNVDISGNYAYVAAGSAGLQVVDISNKRSPRVVAARSLAGNANDVFVTGDTAYVAAGSGGLKIFDVSNPLTPVGTGSLSGGDAWDVVVRNNTAYVANGAGGLLVIDVSNPTSLQRVGSLALAGTAKGIDVDPALNIAVIAAGSSGLHVVSLANPASPVRIGGLNGGDVRDVALSGNFAFLADYARSFTSVDLTNPSTPVLRASTPSSLGGLLQDVTVVGDLAFGAEVFFVNGVPLVDITTPQSPTPRAILNFGAFRDDEGSGIAADGSFVYLTAGRTIAENGVSGDSRLYIGQYQEIVDTGGVPPTVQITSPLTGPLIQGATVTLSATATDDVGVVSVNLLANGLPVATTTAPPHRATFIVPSVTTITFGATGVDYGNNVGAAANVTLAVIPDPLTTIRGRIIDASSAPVGGATVTALDRSTTSAADGSFTLSGLPTIRGSIVVTAVATIAATVLGGVTPSLDPIAGGVINAGDLRIGPRPFITSLTPTSMLSGTTTSLTVAGANLTGSTFAFLPTGVTVTVVSINAGGTSATLSVSIPSATTGRLSLIATNPAGTSDAAPVVGFVLGAPAFNTISVPGPLAADDPDKDGATNAQEITASTDPLNGDTDGDTWPDGLEILLGSSPRNPASIPNPASSSGYVSGFTFSILNNRNPGTGDANSTQYVSGFTFSILNSLNPSTGLAGTNQYVSSLTFSILNSRNPAIGVPNSTQYVSGSTFSILNSLNPSIGLAGANQYVSSLTLSILNNRNPGLGALNSAQYVSSLTFSILNARSPAPVGPTAKFVNGSVFSIANGLNLVSTSLNPTALFNRLMVDRIANPSLFEDAGQKRIDNDGDGVSDEDEIRLRTNPLNSDTDHDGYPDGLEIVLGSDPLDAGSRPHINRPGLVISPAISIQNFTPQARQRAPGQPVAIRRRP